MRFMLLMKFKSYIFFNFDVLCLLFDILESVLDILCYMIFGNEVMFELDVYDDNLIIGIDLIFESDKEKEEFENEDDIDIF